MVAGQLVTFDFPRTSSSTTTNIPGTSASCFVSCTDVTLAPRAGVFAIVQETIPVGQSGLALLRGQTRALVFQITTGAIVRGRTLGAETGTGAGALSGTSAAGAVCLAILLEPTTAAAQAAASAEMVEVLFNGVEGFGGRQ
jgi:hypothetical protein